MTQHADYDVVIVGSGVAGALIATRLVSAGARVRMLEAGPRTDRAAAVRRYRSGAYAYESPAWAPQPAGLDLDAYFVQAGPSAVVLWARPKLADDAGLSDEGNDGFGGVALAQNVRSREEVDAVIADARAAGARITKPAEETFYGGYAAYFADPDGHVWEIAHNP